jgi:hypothetical protein
MLVYFMAIWCILWQFGRYYGNLVGVMAFCIFYGHFVYFSSFGMLHQEKSGNPGCSRTGGGIMTYGENYYYLLSSCRQTLGGKAKKI